MAHLMDSPTFLYSITCSHTDSAQFNEPDQLFGFVIAVYYFVLTSCFVVARQLFETLS